MIVCDTGLFVAASDNDDPLHKIASQFFASAARNKEELR